MELKKVLLRLVQMPAHLNKVLSRLLQNQENEVYQQQERDSEIMCEKETEREFVFDAFQYIEVICD